MSPPFRINNYGSEIKNHFYRESDFLKHQSEYASFDHYLENHLYSITLKKRESGNITSTAGGAKQLIGFRSFYFQLCREALGKPKKRKCWWKGDQPLAYAFVDFAGSRYRLNAGTFPHIHAVMLLPYNCRDRYKSFLDDDLFKLKMMSKLNATEIDIQPYNNSKGSLFDLITYSSKGTGSENLDLSNPNLLWDILPKGGQ